MWSPVSVASATFVSSDEDENRHAKLLGPHGRALEPHQNTPYLMQKYLAKVYISLKPTVNDPEGLTIRGALVTLGYDSVESVRAGKYFQIEVASSSEREAAESVEGMCKRLLANPVIEQYEFELNCVD